MLFMFGFGFVVEVWCFRLFEFCLFLDCCVLVMDLCYLCCYLMFGRFGCLFVTCFGIVGCLCVGICCYEIVVMMGSCGFGLSVWLLWCFAIVFDVCLPLILGLIRLAMIEVWLLFWFWYDSILIGFVVLFCAFIVGGLNRLWVCLRLGVCW